MIQSSMMEFLEQTYDILNKIPIAIRQIGVRGLARSCYYSYRHTGALSRLLIGKNVLTRISRNAKIDLDSRFLLAVNHFPASHIYLKNSKLELTADATLRVPATTGHAFIGPGSVVYIDGQFSMGDSYINSDAKIICRDHISIGKGCAIAWNVQLIDSDQHTLYVNDEKQQNTAPITINDRVWIGHDVTVKKGVTVGAGSVIASNSVVTHDVPPQTMVAGVPATILRENIEWW